MLQELGYKPLPSAIAGEARPRKNRIYLFPATVALLLLVQAIGAGVAVTLGWWAEYGPSHDPATFWVGLAAGAAGALWLGHRLRLEGRLTTAGGMALLGLLLDLPHLLSWTWAVGQLAVVGGIVGIALGLLFPMAFWRQVPRLSPGRKAFLAVAVLCSTLALVVLVETGAGFYGWQRLDQTAGFLALWAGLPLSWCQPVVGACGRRVSPWFWVYLVLSFLAMAVTGLVLFGMAMSAMPM